MTRTGIRRAAVDAVAVTVADMMCAGGVADRGSQDADAGTMCK